MSDRAAVLVAVAAVVGAWLGSGPPIVVAVGLVLVAFAWRRPWLLVAAVLALSGALAARAGDGLVPPLPGPFTGTVVMLGDAEDVGAQVRADVRLADGTHVQAVARRP